NNRPARRDRWWQYAERAPRLYAAIADFDRVLVVALVSKTVMPARVPARQVLAHKLGVFVGDQAADLALLSSTFHTSWAWRNSSTMKADLNYSPSDIYETLPQPALTVRMKEAGVMLDTARRTIMIDRQVGLTKLYNMVHDNSVVDDDIRTLREVHSNLDQAVAEAYGWTDLSLDPGFRHTGQGVRFTFDSAVRTEILDRLLELNHTQYEHLADRGSPTAKKQLAACNAVANNSAENALFNI
ncbi:hypothetical protein ACTG9Q_32935, partial [Actinokineospora sp. 24-640]